MIMKHLLLFLFFISNVSVAGWTNWPDPKGWASTKQACEKAYGGPCYEIGSEQPDEVDLRQVEVEICQGTGPDRTCTKEIHDKLVRDESRIQTKASLERDRAMALQARLDRVKLLKEQTSSRDLSKEELREVLALLLEKEAQAASLEKAKTSKISGD